MRKFTKKIDEEAQINLTPMLDVIFIMLIFFIVTTSFVKESGVDINRPSSVTQTSKKNANIVVGLKQNGEIWIDKKMVDLYFVKSNIEALKTQKSQNAVVIQADKQTKTQLLVRLMDEIRLAGIYDISIATIQE